MTNTEVIATIRAEIERRIENLGISDEAILVSGELSELLSFLSDLEKSAKPTSPEEAMKELDEKIALVKQRGTWDGVDVDKYMDELRGREKSEKPMNPKANAKFKEGDWIKSKRHGKVAQVIMLLRDCYSLKSLDNDGLWLDYNFQDTWELIKEPSEKPMNQEGLEKEIERCVIEPYYDLNGVAVKGATAYLTVNDVADIARHFAQWGAEHLKK